MDLNLGPLLVGQPVQRDDLVDREDILGDLPARVAKSTAKEAGSGFVG